MSALKKLKALCIYPAVASGVIALMTSDRFILSTAPVTGMTTGPFDHCGSADTLSVLFSPHIRTTCMGSGSDTCLDEFLTPNSRDGVSLPESRVSPTSSLCRHSGSHSGHLLLVLLAETGRFLGRNLPRFLHLLRITEVFIPISVPTDTS